MLLSFLKSQPHIRQRGFTLIEVVTVLVLIGVLSTITLRILSAPFQSFQDQSRRATLTAEADLILTRMVREIRHAVPYSVRVTGDGQYLEFIPTIDGGRYRDRPDLDNPDNLALLHCFGDTTDFFEVLGGLLTSQASSNDYVVVYNTSTAGIDANAYAGGVNPTGQPFNRARIGSINLNSDVIILSQGHRFPRCSDQNRFQVIPEAGPVTFYCEDNKLYRVTGYGFQLLQPTHFGSATPRLLSNNVDVCQFNYHPGTYFRNGVAILSLSLQQEDEYIRLLYQAQVVNAL